MAVLGVRQYENRFVSTKHAWSGKTLGLSKSKYRHITSDAFLVTWQCFVNPCLLRKCLPWALGHRRGQTLQSAALDLGSSWKQRLFYNFYNCLNMRRCRTCWLRSSRFQPGRAWWLLLRPSWKLAFKCELFGINFSECCITWRRPSPWDGCRWQPQRSRREAPAYRPPELPLK